MKRTKLSLPVLALKKEIVSSLSASDINQVRGGYTTDTNATFLDGSCVAFCQLKPITAGATACIAQCLPPVPPPASATATKC